LGGDLSDPAQFYPDSDIARPCTIQDACKRIGVHVAQRQIRCRRVVSKEEGRLERFCPTFTEQLSRLMRDHLKVLGMFGLPKIERLFQD
jgi:hypothetical protein